MAKKSSGPAQDFNKNSEAPKEKRKTRWSTTLGIELFFHILIHYTLPGAAAAAGLAMAIAPALDAVGLTTVFSQTASIGGAAIAGPSIPSAAGGAALPTLDMLAG